jgi:hypothetical protein
MRTVHLAWPNTSARGWQPLDDDERMFLDSCDRVPVFYNGDGTVQPDVVVAALELVVDGVALLEG